MIRSKIHPEIFVWVANNDSGEDLLHSHIMQLAQKNGLSIITPLDIAGQADRISRKTMLEAFNRFALLILDCSVEDGHIYHNFLEILKTAHNVIICSRTPLPRNIGGLFQYAPHYDKQESNFSNSQIGTYLEKMVEEVFLSKLEDATVNDSNIIQYYTNTLQKYQTEINQVFTGNAVSGNFISYRASNLHELNRLVEVLNIKTSLLTRVISPGEFAYETEIFTRNRIWGITSILEREIYNAVNMFILLSDDYYDSFWTVGELFSIFYRRSKNNTKARNTFIVRKNENQYTFLPWEEFIKNLQLPSQQQIQRLKHIFLLSDPLTASPEADEYNNFLTQLGRGINKLFNGSLFLSDPGREWYDERLIPCPVCKPRNRKKDDVNWDQHLDLQGYGYFVISNTEFDKLLGSKLQCPKCRNTITIKQAPKPRTIWVPGPLGKEWPKTLKVIRNEEVFYVSDSDE